MTTQLQSGLSYQGLAFDVLEGLFSPQQHGLFPGSDSSGCWRGWFASYAIRDGILLLACLTLAEPEQFLELDEQGNDISKPARYSPLNGVEAVRLRGRIDGSWEFEDVDLPLDYTGTLTLCRLPRHTDVPEYWEARDNPDLDDYEHVLQLTLDKGRVIAEQIVREPLATAEGNDAPPPEPVPPLAPSPSEPGRDWGGDGSDIGSAWDDFFLPDDDKP